MERVSKFLEDLGQGLSRLGKASAGIGRQLKKLGQWVLTVSKWTAIVVLAVLAAVLAAIITGVVLLVVLYPPSRPFFLATIIFGIAGTYIRAIWKIGRFLQGLVLFMFACHFVLAVVGVDSAVLWEKVGQVSLNDLKPYRDRVVTVEKPVWVEANPSADLLAELQKLRGQTDLIQTKSSEIQVAAGEIQAAKEEVKAAVNSSRTLLEQITRLGNDVLWASNKLESGVDRYALENYVVVWEHPDRGGRAEFYATEVPTVTLFGVSHISVPRCRKAVAFTQTNFQGESKEIQGETRLNLSDYAFINDNVRSLKIFQLSPCP